MSLTDRLGGDLPRGTVTLEVKGSDNHWNENVR